MTNREIERRAGLFMLIVLLMFASLMVRLGELQLVQGHTYEQLAAGNRLRLLPVVAPRGAIYDRNGELLATNRAAFSVSLLHMGVEQLDKSLPLLSKLLEMSEDEIMNIIDAHRGRWFEPIRLKSDIAPEMHTQIEEHRRDLPGVVIEPLPVRDYPHGELAAHVLGHLVEIGPEALTRLQDEGYRAGDRVGALGVESVYDRYLRGIDGGRQVEVDARGRPYRTLGEIPPHRGSDIVLTLDTELQRVTERALEDMMEHLQTRERNPYPNAKASAAVAIDVNTGEILAMVSRPVFDPNLFAATISPSDWHAINTDPLLPLLNRSVLGEYQPGSSFKMITAISALETNRTSVGEIFETYGGFFQVTATDTKRCWAHQHGGHGRINIITAIGESCNIVFYELGKRVGIDDIGWYASQFGLGQRTGLEDLTSERPGLVPSRAWKRENYPHDPQWWLSETLDAAIGQGFHLYTPLQMAVYASMLGNGGIQYRPYLVSQVLGPDSSAVVEFGPTELDRANVSAATLDVIRQGMLATTTGRGTAASAFRDFDIDVAGKTGTVENVVPGQDNHGWFVCYAPADNPQIAIAVIIEQGGGGAGAAAPVARTMLDTYFASALEGIGSYDGEVDFRRDE